MYTIIDKQGSFEPSQLQADLQQAGVPVFGVSCDEDDNANVTAVHIVCDGDVDESTIDAVCAAEPEA